MQLKKKGMTTFHKTASFDQISVKVFGPFGSWLNCVRNKKNQVTLPIRFNLIERSHKYVHILVLIGLTYQEGTKGTTHDLQEDKKKMKRKRSISQSFQ